MCESRYSSSNVGCIAKRIPFKAIVDTRSKGEGRCRWDGSIFDGVRSDDGRRVQFDRFRRFGSIVWFDLRWRSYRSSMVFVSINQWEMVAGFSLIDSAVSVPYPSGASIHKCRALEY